MRGKYRGDVYAGIDGMCNTYEYIPSPVFPDEEDGTCTESDTPVSSE